MIEIYLALGLNHRGEKIPLFWHHDRLVLRWWIGEWLQKQAPGYWVSTSEIVAVSRAEGMRVEGEELDISGLKFNTPELCSSGVLGSQF